MEKAVLFKIDAEMNDLLKQTARKAKKSKSELIRKVLRDYLQKVTHDSTDDAKESVQLSNNRVDATSLPSYKLENLLLRTENIGLRIENIDLKIEKVLYLLQKKNVNSHEEESKLLYKQEQESLEADLKCGS